MKVTHPSGSMVTLIGTIVLIGGMIMMTSVSNTAAAEPSETGHLSSLRDAAENEREKILKEYVAARRGEIESVLAILVDSAKQLRSSQRTDAKSVQWYAAKLLGEMHSAEAVPVLLDLLAVRDSNFSPASDQPNPHLWSFPCAVALSKIGMPAVDPLVKQIQTSTPSSNVFHVSCVTLEAILGKELASAAVNLRAKQHPELGQAGWLPAAIEIIEAGHIYWQAMSARDFRFD